MQRQTKHLIEIAMKADHSVSGIHFAKVMEAVNDDQTLPEKLCFTQKEVAYALSMSRQTVRTLVQKRILNPVDISGEGLWRYPKKQIEDRLKQHGEPASD
ncbi:helix-turn-helix domain-containing protein [Pontiella sulfatireligans]|uniref:Helix-turn-helix domain-containing protein n=1 Tax=Pontiella sulfatireligans TaxID=2750658 RepID=A0A6C2UR29_9BACT|nr:helix-turn-helix domain-containing protein [Pontiella sulfatireligans]VGO22559.1 hypothetical protein SCARR_04644 [Pontiella sulfatireligans]